MTKHTNRCGAKTQRGMPCQSHGRGKGGRCKWHGGKSTGPTSIAGKAKVMLNLPRIRALRLRGENDAKMDKSSGS